MPAANTHHHVWRLLMEHGVATFGTNLVRGRDPRSYAHRTSAVRAGQMMQDAGSATRSRSGNAMRSTPSTNS